MNAIRDELKEAVAQSGRDFYDKGLTWGRDADGHQPARRQWTGYVYILPMPSKTLRIATWASITAKDVAVVDIDGRNVGDADVHPTVELLTHLRIYQNRPDANALVHSHGRWTRVFAALRQPIPLLMMDEFKYTGASGIGCARIGPAGSDQVAIERRGLPGPARRRSCCSPLMAPVCLGETDMDEALSVAEIAEDMARLAICARALGDPPEVTLADFVDEETARASLLKREV